jgi:hypothetical protein
MSWLGHTFLPSIEDACDRGVDPMSQSAVIDYFDKEGWKKEADFARGIPKAQWECLVKECVVLGERGRPGPSGHRTMKLIDLTLGDIGRILVRFSRFFPLNTSMYFFNAFGEMLIEIDKEGKI